MKTELAEILIEKARALAPELTQIRRTLHSHPELGFEERFTSELICNKLKELGIPFQVGVGRTGVVGLIEGQSHGKTVGLRADMDAVPVLEETGLPYASKTPGLMHACGHEAHVTCVLGAAELLASLKDRVKGAVKLVFQPAEEIDQGARSIIADGALKGPRPDAFFALHVSPELPCGVVGVREGPMMAAIDTLKISVFGKGGHGANPHKAIDPIVASSAMVMNLQTVVSRNTDPTKPTVISIGTIIGGQADNIIAPRVDMTGTVRCLDPDVHKTIPEIIERICKNTAATFGAEASLTYQKQIPAIVNTREMVRRVIESSEAILGPEGVVEIPVFMGGDDFAFFLEKIPGCYFHLGTKNPKWEVSHDLHNGLFDIDERALPLGAAILAHTALNTLQES